MGTNQCRNGVRELNHPAKKYKSTSGGEFESEERRTLLNESFKGSVCPRGGERATYQATGDWCLSDVRDKNKIFGDQRG